MLWKQRHAAFLLARCVFNSKRARIVISSPERIVDFIVQNEGSIFLFTPLSAKAAQWIGEHVQPDATWFGDALVVEHRYARDLAEGMKGAGLRAWSLEN